jgi:hypothetical protein
MPPPPDRAVHYACGFGVDNATMSSTINPSLREADMQEVIPAGAWCNGEVAYLAWDKVIRVDELEYDGTNVLGQPKHWHTLRCLFRNSAPSGATAVQVHGVS